MLNHKRISNLKVKDAVGIVELTIVLVILPIGIGYITTSIFRLSVWLGIIIGQATLIVIFLSLVFLLGAAIHFPDHLPQPGNDLENYSENND